MKVICTDIHARSGRVPGLDERVVLDNLTESEASARARVLNDTAPLDSHDYYRAVPDTYALVTFESESL